MQPTSPFVDDDADGETFYRALRSVLLSRELLGTAASAAVHMALVLLLALVHTQLVRHVRSPVIQAAVSASEPVHPDLRIPPSLEHPTATSGPQVRSAVTAVAVAAQPPPSSVGTLQTVATLPGLDDMVLRDAVRTGGAGGTDQVSFFGASGFSRRVVFVVDNSNSMHGGKFKCCKEELLTAVSNLSPRQQFYIIFFSDKEHPMLEPNAPKDALNLDTKNWESIVHWVGELKLYRGTRAKNALAKAFELKPDAIFLLTDGKFTDDAYEYLMSLPKTTARIHTIGFKAGPSGAEVLRKIAEKFGGEYSSVSQ